MEISDVVIKLIGQVRPYGSSKIDSKRYENLEELLKLTDRLLIEISDVSRSSTRYEASMKKAGTKAFKWLEQLRDELNETIITIESSEE